MVVDQWAPGVKVAMLPGVSGFKLAKIEIGILLALFPLLLILVVGMVITGGGYGSSQFLTVVMGLIVCDVIASFIVSAACNRRFRAESGAGYTTSTRRFNDVDEVDVASGCVVRLAGEPSLTRDQHAQRVARINAHSRNISDGATDGDGVSSD